MLEIYLDLYRQHGQKFTEDLSHLTDEKEINWYFKEAGGKDYVQSCINFEQLWTQLSSDVKNKFQSLPLRVVKENLLLTVSKFSVETLNQWCDDLLAYSQQQFEEKGRKILTPNIVRKIASKFFPKPEPTKSCLKLHQPVGDEDFKVLLNIKKYGFTPETLEGFKAEVFAGVNLEGEPLCTEHIFPFLEKRNLDPLLLLSPRDRIRFDYEIQLQEKDKELETVRGQFKELEQKLHQRDQRIEELEQRDQQQQTQINQLEQQLKEQNEQFNERMEAFEKFMASQNAA